tara:strand:- start:5034 stop:5207 length:174 start_codon:yes stop_codon:yes gene_type:complete
MEDRVVSHSRYDYYKYYNLYKDRYKLNYLEKKERKITENKNKEYYKDYWINNRWKEK